MDIPLPEESRAVLINWAAQQGWQYKPADDDKCFSKNGVTISWLVVLDDLMNAWNNFISTLPKRDAE